MAIPKDLPEKVPNKYEVKFCVLCGRVTTNDRLCDKCSKNYVGPDIVPEESPMA